jgi:hypothetical protein
MPVTELLAIVAIVATFGLIPSCAMYFQFRIRTKRMDTIVKLTDAGTIDADIVKSLAQQSNYKTDYRFGLIWLAIGCPLTLTVAMHSEASHAMAASIPIFIGIAFLVSGKLRLRGSDS